MKKHKNIIASLGFKFGAMAALAIMLSVFAANAGVPDWVKQKGTFVKYLDEEGKSEIEGYLVTFDLDSDVKSWHELSGSWNPGITTGLFDAMHASSVVSVIFQEDDKIFMRGIEMYHYGAVGEPDLKDNNNEVQNYEVSQDSSWIEGEYDPEKKEVIVTPSGVCFASLAYYDLNVHYSPINRGASIKALNLYESGRISEDHSVYDWDRDEELVRFKCIPWGGLEYMAPVRKGSTVGGYGIRLRKRTQYEMGSEPGNYDWRYAFYTNNSLPVQQVQFFPKDAKLLAVTNDTDKDLPIFLGKEGQNLYLNFSGQLIRGIIRGEEVRFVGGQISSIPMPMPDKGFKLPSKPENELLSLHATGQWNSESDFTTTDDDIVFAYDHANHTLHCTTPFLFMRPSQLPDLNDAEPLKPTAPEAPYHFEELLITDVPDLYSGISDVTDGGSAYIEGGTLICGEPTDIRIYTAAGILMGQAHAEEYDLTALPAGIYIVKAGSATFKISN